MICCIGRMCIRTCAERWMETGACMVHSSTKEYACSTRTSQYLMANFSQFLALPPPLSARSRVLRHPQSPQQLYITNVLRFRSYPLLCTRHGVGVTEILSVTQISDNIPKRVRPYGLVPRRARIHPGSSPTQDACIQHQRHGLDVVVCVHVHRFMPKYYLDSPCAHQLRWYLTWTLVHHIRRTSDSAIAE